MKNNTWFFTVNSILINLIQIVSILPWWTFLLISLVMGFIFSYKNLNIRPFINGFLSGFFNWFFGTLFLHFFYDGILMSKVASVFYLPTFLFFCIIGLIAGLLNGLACYTGFNMFTTKDTLEID